MSNRLVKIDPSKLTGPRSYFTDLDPQDPDYHETLVKRKLKLQLLTKEKIIIAASSLFHDIGYHLFSNDKDLITTLEKGVIIPAIRNQYSNPEDFFKQRKAEYSLEARRFFTVHVTHSVPWDLYENSSWFKNTFYSHLRDPHSLLRQKISFTTSMAEEFIFLLEEEIKKSENVQKFLRRELISKIGENYNDEIKLYLNNYANLIYRLSGSRVVNSEGHFPQSNLTKLGVTKSDNILSDESIFWDIYVETVISFLNSVLRLTPERLDQLSFKDILKIRKVIFDKEFAREYDNLIKIAKSNVNIDDPEKIILKQEEINSAACNLRINFHQRIQEEIKAIETSEHENALWQVANILALISTPTISLIIGSLSALKSIPEITALLSQPLTDSINRRYQWIRNYINSKIGWSKDQKKALIDAYKELLTYGLP